MRLEDSKASVLLPEKRYQTAADLKACALLTLWRQSCASQVVKLLAYHVSQSVPWLCSVEPSTASVARWAAVPTPLSMSQATDKAMSIQRARAQLLRGVVSISTACARKWFKTTLVTLTKTAGSVRRSASAYLRRSA